MGKFFAHIIVLCPFHALYSVFGSICGSFCCCCVLLKTTYFVVILCLTVVVLLQNCLTFCLFIHFVRLRAVETHEICWTFLWKSGGIRWTAKPKKKRNKIATQCPKSLFFYFMKQTKEKPKCQLEIGCHSLANHTPPYIEKKFRRQNKRQVV